MIMSAMWEELHHLVDEIPDDQVPPMLALVRESLPPLRRRSEALATLAKVRERMHDVTGVDEEIQQMRDDLHAASPP